MFFSNLGKFNQAIGEFGSVIKFKNKLESKDTVKSDLRLKLENFQKIANCGINTTLKVLKKLFKYLCILLLISYSFTYLLSILIFSSTQNIVIFNLVVDSIITLIPYMLYCQFIQNIYETCVFVSELFDGEEV